MYPMVVKWAEEFQKVYPKVRIDVSAGGAGKGMSDVLSGMVDIGNVSRDIYSAEIEKGAFWVPVTKDAVVPGAYPSPPARDLNFVTKGRPTSLTKEFIIWTLTDGQKYVAETGYIQ